MGLLKQCGKTYDGLFPGTRPVAAKKNTVAEKPRVESPEEDSDLEEYRASMYYMVDQLTKRCGKCQKPVSLVTCLLHETLAFTMWYALRICGCVVLFRQVQNEQDLT
jgi:hypothetical protein